MCIRHIKSTDSKCTIVFEGAVYDIGLHDIQPPPVFFERGFVCF